MGRGFLLLKWVLEGAFLPPFATAFGDINATVQPDGVSVRNEVFDRLNDRRAALGVESYEWGVFQEFAMLRGHALLRMNYENAELNEARNACRQIFGDFLAQHDSVTLKKCGKAGIRGVLACLARNPQALEEMFDLDPAEFDDNGVLSFEHLITAVAAGHMDLLTGLTVPDLGEFLGAKIGDCEIVRKILNRDNGADPFILKTAAFLNSVQSDTAGDFLTTLGTFETAGRVPESDRRKRNAFAIDFGFERPDGIFESGRLAMHGEDPNRAHQSKFTFYVNLFNPTGVSTGSLDLKLDSIPYPDPISFGSDEYTKRLWGEDASGQPRPNPYIVVRDPANPAMVQHTFALSGVAPAQNRVDFNDKSTFESYFLNPPAFSDARVKTAGETMWLYRGFGLSDQELALLRQQLTAGHVLAPFHILDGNPDQESDEDVEAQLATEIMNIDELIDDPLDSVHDQFDDLDIAMMPDREKFAVRHTAAASLLGISTSESLYISLKGFLGGQNPVVVAFEVPSQNDGIEYPRLVRTDADGNRTQVRLVTSTGRDEREHTFISELRFRRAILFRVNTTTLPNTDRAFELTNPEPFTGTP